MGIGGPTPLQVVWRGSVMHKKERVDVRKLRRILLMVVVPILVLFGAGVANATSKPEPWKGVSPNTGEAACVAKAKELRPAKWLCVGDTLTVTDRKGATKSYAVPGTHITAVKSPFIPIRFQIPSIRSGWDSDSWCENGSLCWDATPSKYISHVKGNAAYGNQDGAIGQFDVNWVQSFNGPYPRWRMWLDWDSGPSIYPETWVAKCVHEISNWPDESCGSRSFYPNDITRYEQRAYYPSSGYEQNFKRLYGSRTYHDDLYGYFRAAGYTYTFKAGTMHTGRWRYCSSNCSYFYHYYPGS